MAKRKHVQTAIETEVLTLSARRCAICFGLENGTDIQQGQIAHLDKDPSNQRIDNLAFLCLRHHDQYDSATRQSKGLTPQEVKDYRNRLYGTVEQWRSQALLGPKIGDHSLQPYLEEVRGIPNLTHNELTFERGIQLIANPRKGRFGFPAVLTIFSKTSMYFKEDPITPLPKERWVLVQATLAGGYGSKVQVQGRTDDEIDSFMKVLQRQGLYAILEGHPTSASREFISLSKVTGEDYLFFSMHTVMQNYSTVDLAFFMNFPVADKLVQYLEETGFAAPLKKK